MTSALIVGGGPGGMTASIALSRVGVACSIVEIDTDWRPAGVGIGLQSAPLRALKSLDLLDDIVAASWPHTMIEMTRADGEWVATLPQMNVNGPDDPPFVTMSRMALHEVLARHVAALGVGVRLGTTLDAFEETSDGVVVVLSDGTTERYDLVIGADGVNSKTRGLILPDAPKPELAGQVIWRIGVRRPAALRHYRIMVAGPHRIGLVPLPDDEMYMWMLDNTLPPRRPSAHELVDLFQERMSAYGGVTHEIAAQITDPEQLDFRALYWLVVPPPWHRGRVLVLGDAAHTTTPHLAFGVGLAIEDAVVLAELLSSGVEPQLVGERLAERRFERCRLVVEASLQLSRWEQEQGPPNPEIPRLFEATFAKLAEPI
jgi:2-polyprenyl-6-methoxyphenol hydroxylase-like FAD-dependent oxidoreductase